MNLEQEKPERIKSVDAKRIKKEFKKWWRKDENVLDKIGIDVDPNKVFKFFEPYLQPTQSRGEDEIKNEVYKNIGSWYKVPIREGMKPEAVKGLGNSKGGGCEVCGGSLVMIRGRHPQEANRQVCPTCAVEIIESILDNCNNRQAYTESQPTNGEDGKEIK